MDKTLPIWKDVTDKMISELIKGLEWEGAYKGAAIAPQLKDFFVGWGL